LSPSSEDRRDSLETTIEDVIHANQNDNSCLMKKVSFGEGKWTEEEHQLFLKGKYHISSKLK
jgi:hypothetical protein